MIRDLTLHLKLNFTIILDTKNIRGLRKGYIKLNIRYLKNIVIERVFELLIVDFSDVDLLGAELFTVELLL